MTTAISRDDVLHLAQLSNLQLADDEIEALQADLSNILDYVAQLGELPVIVIAHEIALRSAKIPQKTIGNVGTADNPPGKRRHVLNDRIVVLALKDLFEARCPILHAHFITIDQQTGLSILTEWFEEWQKILHHLIEMKLEC